MEFLYRSRVQLETKFPFRTFSILSFLITKTFLSLETKMCIMYPKWNFVYHWTRANFTYLDCCRVQSDFSFLLWISCIKFVSNWKKSSILVSFYKLSFPITKIFLLLETTMCKKYPKWNLVLNWTRQLSNL